ncbi:MAG: thioredoxin family protein [Actinomycetota bacterium]|nr:thioredoxin family protein [Actinomycetota bacterium]
MAFLVRAGIVAALAVAVFAGTSLYRRWSAAVQAERPDHPAVPASLLDGAPRTWVVFTTPYCASCGPVEARLRVSDPTARLVKVDATREPSLADAFSIRSAPTALLADGDGRVMARLVGAEAVDRYVRSPK